MPNCLTRLRRSRAEAAIAACGVCNRGQVADANNNTSAIRKSWSGSDRCSPNCLQQAATRRHAVSARDIALPRPSRKACDRRQQKRSCFARAPPPPEHSAVSTARRGIYLFPFDANFPPSRAKSRSSRLDETMSRSSPPFSATVLVRLGPGMTSAAILLSNSAYAYGRIDTQRR